MMRRTWHERGIAQPRFRPVATEQDLHDAAAHAPFPLLLKAAWSAGSTAHRILRYAAGGPGGLGAGAAR